MVSMSQQQELSQAIVSAQRAMPHALSAQAPLPTTALTAPKDTILVAPPVSLLAPLVLLAWMAPAGHVHYRVMHAVT